MFESTRLVALVDPAERFLREERARRFAREQRFVEALAELERIEHIRREAWGPPPFGPWSTRMWARRRPPSGPATPLTIFVSGTVNLWLRADLGVTHAGGFVSQWVGQEPGANVFSQSGPSSQPAYDATGGAGGKPSINFDGSDDLMTTPGTTLAFPITSSAPRFYCGVMARASHVAGRVFWGGNTSTRHSLNTGTAANTVRFANLVGTESLMTPGVFYEYEIFASNNAASDYIKVGASVLSGIAINSAAITAGALALGALNTAASFGTPRICEKVVLSYNPVTEITAYRAYTAAHFGVS